MTAPPTPTTLDVLPDRKWWYDLSPDWVLAFILILGLVTMLSAIGTGNGVTTDEPPGSRIAVGMTPSDGAIAVRLNPCGSEMVTTVALRAVEASLTLWEATATNTQERYVFVVGQPPTTFLETIPMIENLPRGALLEVVIIAEETHTTQFLFADLLPGLWNFRDTYYPEDKIDQVIEEDSPCPGGLTPATAGRRAMVIVGFFIAAAAGAGLLSRRLVTSDL